VSFILHILFTGLIAFVPSKDGTEVTVLLLNVNHNNHTSDGASLAHHKPLLMARAGTCTGDCPTRDEGVARYMFADKSLAEALDSLELAVSGGGAWELAGSDLSIHKGSTGDPDLPALIVRNNVRNTVDGQLDAIPTTATEREDFSWVADLPQVCPSDCTLNSAVLDAQPPSGLIAARLHLRSGKLFTYAVARIGSNVTPVHFKRLDGEGSASPYSQAVASWVGADIEVSGDSIEIVDEKFNGDPGRTMTLTPDTNGKVEIAVLNLPRFVPPASPANGAPQVGKHFETYYELAQTPPAQETRLVPKAEGAASDASYPEVAWGLIHPQDVVWSELLNKLRLDVGRSAYDRTLCPPTQIPQP
jgi:hypothetical protein